METSLTLLGRLAGSPSEDDWRRFAGLYEPLLRAWLTRAGVPAADQDDLTQEVLMVVVREVAGFDRRRPGAFRAWLGTVLANRLLDFFKSRAARPLPLASIQTGEAWREFAAPDSELSRLWEKEHDEYVAARAMERVKVDFAETTWEAFRRQVVEGAPARRVAAELGLSLNAVLLAKSRLLSRLRAEVSGMIE